MAVPGIDIHDPLVQEVPEAIEGNACMLRRVVVPPHQKVGEGGARGSMDKIGSNCLEKSLDSAFQPRASSRHRIELNMELGTRELHVVVQVPRSPVHRQCLRDTVAHKIVPQTEQLFYVSLLGGRIEITKNQGLGRRRLKAYREAGDNAAVFITHSREPGPPDG